MGFGCCYSSFQRDRSVVSLHAFQLVSVGIKCGMRPVHSPGSPSATYERMFMVSYMTKGLVCLMQGRDDEETCGLCNEWLCSEIWVLVGVKGAAAAPSHTASSTSVLGVHPVAAAQSATHVLVATKVPLVHGSPKIS